MARLQGNASRATPQGLKPFDTSCLWLEVDSVSCRGERQRERAPGQKGVNAREPGRSKLVQQESAGLAHEPGLSKNGQIEQKVSHSKIGNSKVGRSKIGNSKIGNSIDSRGYRESTMRLEPPPKR
jgi:hypothetical protein